MRARLSALVLVPLATALVTLGLADTHAQQPKPTDQPSVIAMHADPATLFKTGPSTYSGTLIRTSGPPFSAVPWNPQAVTRAEVGTAAVTFTNGNRATFNYTVALNGAMFVNCAILVLAAAVFFKHGIVVNEIQQAQQLLSPLLSTSLAGVFFAVALLFAGLMIASSSHSETASTEESHLPASITFALSDIAQAEAH